MPIITTKPAYETPANEKLPNATDASELFDAFLQVERRRLVERLRKGRELSRRIYGRCEGQKPYGHYSAERATLELIYELRRNRLTSREIAASLNGRGLYARSGKPWQAAIISRIIRRAK
ncbi:recombinase family protein [Edaphobacter sp.]|uniref:recombinase family protein n=1 Tax=Edaphobacter sp. TaxID=1934404 RepID=UPI002DBC239F|nr:recombinase family protein [Edaphobacter sp.]HEU5340156.1 recombinase family protein [Edaphobacter sp.]